MFSLVNSLKTLMQVREIQAREHEHLSLQLSLDPNHLMCVEGQEGLMKLRRSNLIRAYLCAL